MESSRRDIFNDIAGHRSILKNNQNTYYPVLVSHQNRLGLPKTGVPVLAARQRCSLFCPSLQVCVALISVTWAASLAVFALLVLPRGGYYFNASGLLACDPFYSRPSLRILASCSLYFPTTMVLMYCYGSAFHVNNKLRLKRATCVPPCGTAGAAPSCGSASLTQPSAAAAAVTADKVSN